MNLDNRNVIITGGSSGIGKELANICAQKGANVIIIARRQSLLESALGDIRSNATKSRQRFASHAFDVADVEAVTKFAADYNRDFGPADILINNAGIAVVDHFENTDPNDFQRVMSIDYFGVVNMTRAILPCMKRNGRGHVVNISSMLGFMGVYGYSAYCPAKFAVSAFSEVLRYELDKYNIKVSVVYPPDVETPQLAMCDATMPEVTRSSVS
jgi:3-dehydrosphinganine reductase